MMRKRTYLTLLFLLSLVSLSNLLRAQDSVQYARIAFKDTVHDFKSVALGTEATYVFEFRNTGNSMLLVTGAQPSCSCARVNWSRGPVMPGEKGTLDVTFHAEELGAFDKGIWVTSNGGGTQPTELRVRGLVFFPEKAKTKPRKSKGANAPKP